MCGCFFVPFFQKKAIKSKKQKERVVREAPRNLSKELLFIEIYNYLIYKNIFHHYDSSKFNRCLNFSTKWFFSLRISYCFLRS